MQQIFILQARYSHQKLCEALYVSAAHPQYGFCTFQMLKASMALGCSGALQENRQVIVTPAVSKCLIQVFSSAYKRQGNARSGFAKALDSVKSYSHFSGR